MNSGCLFCKFIARNIPLETVVFEDEETLAFLDANPRALGHTLVIPKLHAAALTDIPNERLGPLFSAVKEVANRLRDRLKADGLTIGMNQDKAAGQSIDHLHIHIIPRFFGDQGGSIHTVVDNPPQQTLSEVTKLLTS